MVRSRCMPRQSCGGAKLAAPISFAALAACFGSKNALARDGEAVECRNCRSKPNARQTCGGGRCGAVRQSLGANQTDPKYRCRLSQVENKRKLLVLSCETSLRGDSFIATRSCGIPNVDVTTTAEAHALRDGLL